MILGEKQVGLCGSPGGLEVPWHVCETDAVSAASSPLRLGPRWGLVLVHVE